MNKNINLSIFIILITSLSFIIYKKSIKSHNDLDLNYLYRNNVELINTSIIKEKRKALGTIVFSPDKKSFIDYNINKGKLFFQEIETDSGNLIKKDSILINDIAFITGFNNRNLFFIDKTNSLKKIDRLSYEPELLKDGISNAIQINNDEFFVSVFKQMDTVFRASIYHFNFNGEFDEVYVHNGSNNNNKSNIIFYDGFYEKQDNDKITYTYYYLPKVVILNSNNKESKELHLSKQNLSPTIYSKSNNFVLSLDNKDVNKSSLIDTSNNNIIIFSNYFEKYDKGILLDYYSLNNNEYLYSKYLFNSNYLIDNSKIKSIIKKDNQFILFSSHYKYLINFKL